MRDLRQCFTPPSPNSVDTMEPASSVSAADECLTWKLATKLGLNSQNAPQDEQAVHLAAHRWAWFADSDREWRAGFERHVKRRLEAHTTLRWGMLYTAAEGGVRLRG